MKSASTALASQLSGTAVRLPAELRRDVTYALRRLVKAPGFAVVGVVSLAIGIGLCSLFFAQVNAIMLRPLPGARDPDALVSLQRPVPYPYRYRSAWRREARTARPRVCSVISSRRSTSRPWACYPAPDGSSRRTPKDPARNPLSW